MAVMTENTQSKITAYLLSKGAKEVLLFGSQLSGNASEHSDIDIGVRGLSPSIFFSVWYDLEDISNSKIDLVDFDSSSRFYNHLLETNSVKKSAVLNGRFQNYIDTVFDELVKK